MDTHPFGGVHRARGPTSPRSRLGLGGQHTGHVADTEAYFQDDPHGKEHAPVELPRMLRQPWFKGLIVTLIVVIGLSPIVLKVDRAEKELNQRRYHNSSYKDKNPHVENFSAPAEQWNYYCHATFPGALGTLNYTTPKDSTLLMVQVVTRNGDTAPCNVLPHDTNVTWFCNDPDPYDPAVAGGGFHIKATHVRDEPAAYRPSIWDGNCYKCDLTGRGLQQFHMLGEALGALYSQFLSLSPNNVHVRCTDTPRAWRSAEAFVRALMGFALDSGTVEIATGLNPEADLLNPQPGKCPALRDLLNSVEISDAWKQNRNRHKGLMEQLQEITETQGSVLADDWSRDFSHFADTVRSRWCHDMPLPCSRGGTKRCVTEEMAQELFAAADWEFVRRHSGEQAIRKARLSVGPLLGQMLHNMLPFITDTPSALKEEKQFYVYTGHDTTIAPLLTALNITGWHWPPYAANLVLEVWQDNQDPGFKFMRILYNGFEFRPGFCSGSEPCEARMFMEYVHRTVVPDDLTAECNQPSHAPNRPLI